MSYQIFPCSEPMREFLLEPEGDGKGQPDSHANAKYPFAELDHGQAFAVSYADANEMDLRSAASNQNKKGAKRFKVKRHNNANVFEVARIK